MRLLISGSKRNPNSIGSFIISNFDGSFAFEILEFHDRFAELIDSRFYRLAYRFFPWLLVRKMDRLLLDQVNSFRPTVVLIFKGMEISKWSLKRIKAMGVKLVNYNFDHPFRHFSRGTGNRYVSEAIPYYDLHISYSEVIAAELAKEFNVQTARIPFGFHITAKQYDQVIVENRSEINRACFVGNPDELRIEYLKHLIAESIPVSVYGFGWERHFQSNEGIEIHRPRRPDSFWTDPLEFWIVMRQYRIQLNFFRPHNEASHNLRTFEVPAAGGILLTPDSAEQRRFFDVGTEIFTYTDVSTLISQCRWLMGSEKRYIDGIRESARQKSVVSEYSYERRTRDLLDLLGKSEWYKANDG